MDWYLKISDCVKPQKREEREADKAELRNFKDINNENMITFIMIFFETIIQPRREQPTCSNK